jgi:hypothetical protein
MSKIMIGVFVGVFVSALLYEVIYRQDPEFVDGVISKIKEKMAD